MGDYVWLFVWLGVAVFTLIVEASTTALVAIWFSAGAAVAAVMAAFHLPFWSQIAAFLAVSVVLLLLLYKKLAVRKTVKTNADALVGESCVVTEEINRLRGTGHVQLKGLVWSAESADPGAVIPEGTVVVVRAIEGAHVVCEPSADT